MTDAARIEDLRGARSASREGSGKAKARRDHAVAMLARDGLHPIPPAALPPFLVSPETGLLEFWLLWHLHGGFDGLKAAGMSEATIYRKVKAFRLAVGEHPDDYRVDGVPVQVETFLERYAFDASDPDGE